MRNFLTVCTLVIGFACLSAGEPGWRNLPPLPEARAGHAAVMVHTGDVLVVGGRNAAGLPIASAMLVSGGTGSVVPTINNDATPRTNSAVVVAPGRGDPANVVYVIGGYTGTAGNYVSSAVVSRLRYDTIQRSWRFEFVGNLPVAVGDCRAVYDGNGSIVVSGGFTQLSGAIASGVRSTASASIDVTTGAIRRLGNHTAARAEHGAYRFIDQSGVVTVMVAGGEAAPPPSTELLAGTSWDPRANAPLADRRKAVPVSDITGTARVFGGENGGSPLPTCEWYDPKSGWRNAPKMNVARCGFSATAIASISDTAAAYIAVAGRGTAGDISSCEIFALPTGTDPAGVWTPFYPLTVAASERQVALTSSNVPIVVGGSTTASVEVFQPLRTVNVSFPSTEVGARSDSVWIEITNTWMLPISIRHIQILDGADFIIASDTTVLRLAPTETRKLLAWFRPSQPGLRTTRVAVDMGIVADTFRLSGNGFASTVQVLTTSMDHGDVPIGTSNKICLPLLKNNGTDTTWVDSIVVDPPGSYIVLSPTGKTPVPPGVELQVCIVFAPQTRGAVAGTATMHIGPRAYPVAVVGNGIRTLAVLRTSGCDTLSAQRNDQVITTGLVENIADRDVTVTNIMIQAAIAGSAVLTNPSILPFTLRPGEILPVDVTLTVQREGEERLQLTAASNSDSLIAGTLCVVIRSRSIVLSVSSINVGDMCVGDSVYTSVVLTNASAIDPIQITDVVVEGTTQATIQQSGSMVIDPRSSYVLNVTIGATQSGLINGTIVVNTSTGSTGIPIRGNVLDAVVLGIPDATMLPGSIQRLPLEIGATTAAQLVVDIAHASDLLAITGVEEIVGQVSLAPTSGVQRMPNGTRLTLVWNGSPPTTPSSINLVVEALRGSDLVTEVRAVRAGTDQACVLSDTGTIYVDPMCGQERSLVTVGKGADVLVAPSPVHNTATFVVSSTVADPLELRIVDATGVVVYSANVSVGSIAVEMTAYAGGLYGVQLFTNHGLASSKLFLLEH